MSNETLNMRRRDQMERLCDMVCVKATMVCQLISELEKYDKTAVERILKYADQHRERHRQELSK